MKEAIVAVKELEKLRPCGRLETYSTARHHLGYYNNVALTATYANPGWINSLPACIYSALKKVIEEHPKLSAIPRDEEKSYPDVYFARLPEIDLRSCVEFQERTKAVPQDGEVDEELDEVLHEQHSYNFKRDAGTKPFWRLVILTSPSDERTFTATWTFHHALSDGGSALLFHETFLAGLNSLDTTPNDEPIVQSLSMPLPPPFEDLHPMTISWSYFFSTLAKIILPSYFNKRPSKLWTGNTVPSEIPQPPLFNFRTLIFSAATTKRLAQISRKHDVSLTCTLEALLAASLFTHLPASKFDKVKFSNPMAMRRFLRDVPTDQMTNALTQFEHIHQRPTPTPDTNKSASPVLQNFSWSDAHAVRSTIACEIAKEGADNPIALLKYVSNMHDFFKSTLGKPRQASMELSNIGMYKNKVTGEDEGEEEKWKIGRVTFSQCPNPTGAAICASVVTGGDVELSVNFCWFEGSVEGGFVQLVIESVREGVVGLVEGEEI
jgi:hypothetical protein